MMDYPYATSFMAPLPANPVKVACNIILGSSNLVTGLAKAAALAYGDHKCNNIWEEFISCADPTGCGTGPDSKAWDFQVCNEMIMPAGSNNITDMFPKLPFTIQQRVDYCQRTWGIIPRDNWLNIHLWGKNIKQATNIVFSNGNLDPWRQGGVLRNLSHSVIAVVMEGAAHHLDLRSSNPADPPSVVEGRAIEVEHITKWISQAANKHPH